MHPQLVAARGRGPYLYRGLIHALSNRKAWLLRFMTSARSLPTLPGRHARQPGAISVERKASLLDEPFALGPCFRCDLIQARSCLLQGLATALHDSMNTPRLTHAAARWRCMLSEGSGISQGGCSLNWNTLFCLPVNKLPRTMTSLRVARSTRAADRLGKW